jgi:membrane associated rhomboid family serine protease
VRFGVLYAVSLVCGAAGALILTPHSLTVGASGAIFGLLGALAVNLRQRGISIWQTGIGGLIVINLLITLAVPSISVGGHVGGLIGGAVTGMALDQRGADGKRSVVGIAVAVAIGLFAVAVALSAAGR